MNFTVHELNYYFGKYSISSASLKQTVFLYRNDELVEVTYNYFISDDFSITQDMELKYNKDDIQKAMIKY